MTVLPSSTAEEQTMKLTTTSKRRRNWLLASVGGATIAVTAGGVAYATIPTNGVITGCYTSAGGSLRVVDPATGGCKKGETQLAWNVQGAQGASGPAGPAGPAGPSGAPGPAGSAGVSGYQVVHRDVPLDAGNAGSANDSVACPAGKKVLGGGATFLDSDGEEASVSDNIVTSANPLGDGSGWSVSFEYSNLYGFVSAIRLYATCATVS
jgi:hypothetical protein